MFSQRRDDLVVSAFPSLIWKVVGSRPGRVIQRKNAPLRFTCIAIDVNVLYYPDI